VEGYQNAQVRYFFPTLLCFPRNDLRFNLSCLLHCRGKGLAAFLKAIGYLIPLMDAEYANYYTREVMLILIREFQSPDEEMKKIVLKVKSVVCLFFLACLA